MSVKHAVNHISCLAVSNRILWTPCSEVRVWERRKETVKG